MVVKIASIVIGYSSWLSTLVEGAIPPASFKKDPFRSTASVSLRYHMIGLLCGIAAFAHSDVLPLCLLQESCSSAALLHIIEGMNIVCLTAHISGLLRSGKNAWKMKIIPGQGKVSEFCGWSGKSIPISSSLGDTLKGKNLLQE